MNARNTDVSPNKTSFEQRSEVLREWDTLPSQNHHANVI